LLTVTGLTASEWTKIHTPGNGESSPIIYNKDAFEKSTGKLSVKKLFKETFLLQSNLELPLQLKNGEQYNFSFYSRKVDIYNNDHVDLFNRLGQTLKLCIEQVLSSESKSVSKQVDINATALSPDDSSTGDFDGIIGSSPLMLEVFDNITQVAPF